MLVMLRNRSRAVTKQSPIMADHQASPLSPPTSQNPTRSISYFLGSPRFFNGGLLPKSLSPTSILDTKKQLCNFAGNPFGFSKTPKKPTKIVEKIKHPAENFGSEGIALALVLIDENSNSNICKPKTTTRKLLSGSKLKIQIPKPFPNTSPESPGDFGIKSRNSHFSAAPTPTGFGTAVGNHKEGSRNPQINPNLQRQLHIYIHPLNRIKAAMARIRAPMDPERFKDWDVQIKPDQKLKMAVESGKGFHISKIELETVVVENGKEANKVPPVVVENAKEAKEVPVIVTFDGYKCVIGTLSESATEIFFDIEIHAERFQFYHEWKERSVKISGYYYEKPVMSHHTDDEEDSTEGCAYVDEEAEKEDMENEVSFVECVHSDLEDDVYENEYMETDEEDDSMVDSSADNEEKDVDEENEAVKRPAESTPESLGPDKKGKIQH